LGPQPIYLDIAGDFIGESDMHRLQVILITAVLLLGTGCSYHRAHVWYRDYDNEVAMKAPSWDGEVVGTVSARDGGAIWTKCTDVARDSVWHLIDQTEQLGGNAIGDFRWINSKPGQEDKPKRDFAEPTCQKKWGWFLLWPFLLTPQFMSARVEAQAYRVDSLPELTSEIYFIPDSVADRELLVDRIIDELRRSDAGD
jgi:hypothetical protein